MATNKSIIRIVDIQDTAVIVSRKNKGGKNGSIARGIVVTEAGKKVVEEFRQSEEGQAFETSIQTKKAEGE